MTLTQVSSRGVEDTLRWSLGASGTDHYTFTGPGLTGTVNDPTIYLTRGQTYIFENNSGGHPFQIQSTAGSGGSAYNTGVTNNGGGNGTEIKITVAHDSPDILYYQCTSHANMGGQFNIAGSVADGSISTAKIADDAVDADKLANSINTAIAANTAKTSNATHTGDVTGSTSLTIANDAVTTAKIANNAVTADKLPNSGITLSKIQDVSQDRILGRQSSGSGVLQELNAANIRTMINVADGATAGGGKLASFAQYQQVGTASRTSNTFGIISSNFSLDLTPATNSKVLISFCAPKGASATNPVRFKAVRTKSGTSTDLGMSTTADWQGNYATMGNYIGGDNANQIFHVAFQWVDIAPGGDGSTTINYQIHWAINSGTAYIGQSNPASIVQRAGGTQFYVMEIAA
tara:strand:- start:128 stop:1339 length:1212 start_codon:yes stop_codon:yes gene_type:complete